jgi:uncharacterized membrane protein
MTAAAQSSKNDSIPSVQKIDGDAHWRWLALGWSDFKRGWRASIGVGIGVAVASLLIVFALWMTGLEAFIPAACGGFAILGPVLATSLYDISQRLDAGESVTWRTPFERLPKGMGQVIWVGFALFFILMVWARIATLLYAIFTGTMIPIPGQDFIHFALETPNGLAMLAVGSVIGAFLSVITFAIAAFSIPMLTDVRVDAFTAMAMSCQAFLKNPMSLLAWGFNVALFIALSLVTGFLALIFVFPWLGHATWRGYKEMFGR